MCRDNKGKKTELEKFNHLQPSVCVLLLWQICVGPVYREHLENYLAQLESHTYSFNAVPANRSKPC